MSYKNFTRKIQKDEIRQLCFFWIQCSLQQERPHYANMSLPTEIVTFKKPPLVSMEEGLMKTEDSISVFLHLFASEGTISYLLLVEVTTEITANEITRNIYNFSLLLLNLS